VRSKKGKVKSKRKETTKTFFLRIPASHFLLLTFHNIIANSIGFEERNLRGRENEDGKSEK